MSFYIRIIYATIFFILSLGSATISNGQNIDSIRTIIKENKLDTNLTIAYRDLSYHLYKEKGDSAIQLAYQGLQLAKQIKDLYAEAANNEMIAIILSDIGDYAKSLEFHYQSLKLQEQRKSLKGMSSAYNNIGIVNMHLKDYVQALRSYQIADSLNQTVQNEHMRYSLALNMGDVFEKMNQLDSAFQYYNRSLGLAGMLQDDYYTGLSMLGMANIYRLKMQADLSMPNYYAAIRKLETSGDHEQLCEALIGLGKCYDLLGKKDSVFHYGRLALRVSKSIQFNSKSLDITRFLGEQFASVKRYDSAYIYNEQARVLNDSLLSTDKLRLAQQIKFEEQIRQQKLKEDQLKEEQERKQHLQYMLIALFILVLFLITAFLSRIKIRISIIKFLGVVSLLFLFEFLTLLLHPRVQEITHHTPVLEILIFVLVAAILIPAHHKLEHWVIEKLLYRRKEEQEHKLEHLQTPSPKETHSPKQKKKK